jgi:hypothetical protein
MSALDRLKIIEKEASLAVGELEAPPVEKPKEEPKKEPPVEEPKPSGPLKVGLVAGGWGPQEIADLKAGGHSGVRLENPSSITAYTGIGLSVLWLANHYSTSGVKSLNRSEILNRVRVADATGAWVVEVLNEPGGDWFWGPVTEADSTAYGQLLLEAHAAVPNAKLLASWDGGHAGGGEWGQKVLKATPSLKGQPWLRWSVHCYAGSGANPAIATINPCAGLCGHLPTIDAAHAATASNVIVSELGFPTLTGTGDSPHCTEAQQKLGHEMCLRYCRERSYVEGYFAYGYRDGNGAKGYGLVRSDDSKKPAWSVVH